MKSRIFAKTEKKTMTTTPDAEWFARMRSDRVDDKTCQDFDNWLEEDVSNEVEYAVCVTVSDLCNDLKGDPEIEELYQDGRKENRNLTRSKVKLFKSVPAVPRALMALAACGAMAFLIVTSLHSQKAGTYSTLIGEQRVVALNDGSTIEMNTECELEVDFTGHDRLVVLEKGEALFNVAPDESRPFIVKAGTGTVRVLGTIFAVLRDDSETRVSVLGGRVSVTASAADAGKKASEETALLQGQELLVNASGYVAVIDGTSLDRIDAWRQGKLKFEDIPLDEALREINRYVTKPLLIGDDALKSMRLTGLFYIDRLNTVAGSLERALPITATEGRSNIVLREKVVAP